MFKVCVAEKKVAHRRPTVHDQAKLITNVGSTHYRVIQQHKTDQNQMWACGSPTARVISDLGAFPFQAGSVSAAEGRAGNAWSITESAATRENPQIFWHI